jgi:myo-inositol 2-dehydrogenase/D-chiro-inositol 1-dehydrogenase
MVDVSTDSVLRYGIIGTGMMGLEHIRNLLSIKGCLVTEVGDPNMPG